MVPDREITRFLKLKDSEIEKQVLVTIHPATFASTLHRTLSSSLVLIQILSHYIKATPNIPTAAAAALIISSGLAVTTGTPAALDEDVLAAIPIPELAAEALVAAGPTEILIPGVTGPDDALLLSTS